MLKKRIKKFICVLSAVIIAFSCFSVSAKETSFEVDNLYGYVYYEVYDENNNYLDTVYITPDSLIINSESDKIYFDISSTSSVFIKKGYFIRLFFSFEAFSNSIVDLLSSNCFIFHSAERLSLLDASYSYIRIDSNDSYTKSFSSFDDTHYFLLSRFSNYYDCELNFVSLCDASTLSLCIEYAENVSNIEQYISSSHAQPRKYKFFSDIGTFFKSAVEWMSDIFDKFVENPAILVLVIGFVIVGFCFGLLRKFIFES